MLLRPKFRSYLSTTDARRFVVLVRQIAELAADPPSDDDNPVCDPGDAFLVALARDTNADVLVSGDSDLVAVSEPGLVVMTPSSFLAALNS